MRLNETWRGILRRSEELVREELQDHSPMDRTEVEFDLNKLSVFRKGQKFVPAQKGLIQWLSLLILMILQESCDERYFLITVPIGRLLTYNGRLETRKKCPGNK